MAVVTTTTTPTTIEDAKPPIVAVSAGIAQAMISEAETNNRIALPRASRSRATSTPSTIVRATLTKQKINVRHSTVQK